MKISDNKIETKLQKDYRASCEKYIKAFEKRHDVSFEFWVGDEIGGVASFGDYFFNLTDIINDVNSDDSTELIFEWYNACMEHEDWVNYDSYRRGYRYPADAPKKVYGFLKDKPSKPLSELHKDTETCEEIARLLCSEGWQYASVWREKDYTGITIEAHPMKYIYLKIYDDGGFIFENGERLFPIPNCFQIVSLLIDRGYVIGKV